MTHYTGSPSCSGWHPALERRCKYLATLKTSFSLQTCIIAVMEVIMAVYRCRVGAHPPWSETLLLEPLYSVPTSGAMTICGTRSTSVPNIAASDGPYRISDAGLLTPMAASVAGLAVIALTAACAHVLGVQYSMQEDLSLLSP